MGAMRSKTVIFRASPEFVERLEERAHAQGLSKSEAIRRAVFGGDAMDDATTMEGEFNPFAHLKAAATGDIEAQRSLARAGQDMAVLDGDTQALLDGLCFARLAAAHGYEADAKMLAGMLAYAAIMLEREGQTDLHDVVHAEFIAVVSALADAGVASAENDLPGIVAESARVQVEMSQQIRKMMAEI